MSLKAKYLSKFFLYTFAALLGLTIPSPTILKPTIIDHHPGGSVLLWAGTVDFINEIKGKVEVRGNCWSACTMFLGVKDVCYHPSASFHFHSARRVSPENPSVIVTSEWGNAILQSYYPPETNLLIAMNYGLALDTWIHVYGHDLQRLGIPACD